MPAVGMGIAWFGYGLSLWGYCLVKGYNVTLAQLLNPVHPYHATWPPSANIPASTVFPDGKQAAAREAPDTVTL
jgi:hypothetical protein